LLASLKEKDVTTAPVLAMPPAMTMSVFEIGDARPARSPDTKVAIAYLTASGATAITIVETDGVCSFHVGHKIDPHAVSVQWLPETTALGYPGVSILPTTQPLPPTASAPPAGAVSFRFDGFE
jgi:hypothetical protein